MEEAPIYNDATEKQASEWELSVVLSRIDGRPISEETINRFYDKLVDLVEEHGLQMGGGISPCE